MKIQRREVFTDSKQSQVWVEGESNTSDSKVLLTITSPMGEETALISNEEIVQSKAKLNKEGKEGGESI